MPGTDSELRRVSQYTLEIECPQCGEKMILHIGLMGEPKSSSLACIGCRNEIVPVVPGPIVGGPFSLRQLTVTAGRNPSVP
jgi:hypothetical protein